MKPISLILLLLGSILLSAGPTPYVGSYEALYRFSEITEAEMDVVRTKKILIASRSFGLNLKDGLSALANTNGIYEILDTYTLFNVFDAGGDLTIIPDTVFETSSYVHFLASTSPPNARISQFETLISSDPWNFWEDIDVGMIIHSTPDTTMFPFYSAHMDSLQARYPYIQFIYTTAGYQDSALHYTSNVNADQFNQLIRAKYKGNAPLYDMGAIVSRDGECGLSFCPDYSTDPAGVHPNTVAGETALGKGFLVMLRDLCFGTSACTSTELPSIPDGLAGTALSTTEIRLDWNASTHPACGVKYYRVRRNGSPTGITYTTSFTDRNLTEGTAYTYDVAAVSLADSASGYSDSLSASTPADTIGPALTGTVGTPDSSTVVLEFTEPLDSASACDPANYAIDNGITVSSAVLTEPNLVALTVSGMDTGITYTVTVTNVTDIAQAKNPVASGTSLPFTFVDGSGVGSVIGYWSLDDEGSNVLDYSGNGHHGPASGTEYDPSGAMGGCRQFDTAYSTGIEVGTFDVAPGVRHNNGLTVALWVKPTGWADPVYRFPAFCAKNSSFKLSSRSIGTVTRLSYTIKTTDGSFGGRITGGADITLNKWVHLAITYDGDSARAYTNGALIETRPASGTLLTSADPVILGSDTHIGMLDEVVLCDYALNAQEMADLYAGTFSLPAANGDSLAVRALLDANGAGRTVDASAVYDGSGRITTLYLQTDLGGTMNTLNSYIDHLTGLTKLHVYGPLDYDHSGTTHLTHIDPALGNLTQLEELLINDNDLDSLPVEITALKNLTAFSAGNNRLCGLPDTIWTWLDTYDPDWETTQEGCATAIHTPEPAAAARVAVHILANGIGFTHPDDGMAYTLTVRNLAGTALYSIQHFQSGSARWQPEQDGAGMYLIEVESAAVRYGLKAIIVGY